MAQIRVYELAKELGVKSVAVLSVLKDWGEFVRSASSLIETPVARRLRQHFAALPATRERPSPPNPSHEPGRPRAHEEHELAGFPLPQTQPRRSAPRPGARYGPRKRQDKKPPLNEWARLFFEDSDRQEWAEVGIYEPHVAQECIEKGLGPEDLRERVEGRRIGERLASGERLSVILAIGEEERRRRAV